MEPTTLEAQTAQELKETLLEPQLLEVERKVRQAKGLSREVLDETISELKRFREDLKLRH